MNFFDVFVIKGYTVGYFNYKLFLLLTSILVNKNPWFRDDKPYCADCFGELFSKRCTACSKPITGTNTEI